jgi:biopolymer transport protein ExbD
MRLRGKHEDQRVELQMTSMIDVVFLLLIFFILTFKIVELEGDFSIRMPLADNSAGQMDDSDLPIKLRLRADSEGRLAAIELNDNNLGTDFAQLRSNILTLVGDPSGPGTGEGPELEIDTDYNLRYENVVDAITAVSGYKVGNEQVKLIQKIKFAPPRRD